MIEPQEEAARGRTDAPRWASAVTAWDRALAWQTAALALLLGLLATAVLVATDEREATFHTRLARVCALAPALLSLAISVLTRRLERAGDLRSLAAVGVTRGRALSGSIVLATALGLLAALALALGWGSLDGLFPPLSGEIWRQQGRGFVAPGIAIDGLDGAVTFVGTSVSTEPRVIARSWVGASIALLAVALPAWTSQAERWPVRLGIGVGLVLGAIVCFHAVSAGKHPALLLLPPCALLAYLGALALRSRAHELRAAG